MCRRVRVAVFLPAVVLAWSVAGIYTSVAAEPGTHPAGGRVAGCEHFAFQRAKVAEGLGGPAREACKSWHVSMCVDKEAAAYALDAENCQVYRVKDGTVRLLAGDGIRGYRDGPADRARFDFGVGSYQDAAINADAEGSVYVAEGMAGRLRKIYRDADRIWHVQTIAGGGSRMPIRGESIPATEMEVGCASRFALAADGTVYFATHSGVYCIRAVPSERHHGCRCEWVGTLLASREDLLPVVGKNIHDWHVGGSHITPDGWFYWMPCGGPNLLRLNVHTRQVEKFAGVDKVVQGLDGPTLRETGFHTVFIVYTPNGKIMFTSGGDESILRRIKDVAAAGSEGHCAAGSEGHCAAHLQKDGTFLPGGKQHGWHLNSPLCIDSQGCLYTETGIYAWGGFIVRVVFADQDARE